METARPRVVIVEDGHDVADLVIEVLNEGFDAVTAGDAATCFQRVTAGGLMTWPAMPPPMRAACAWSQVERR